MIVTIDLYNCCVESCGSTPSYDGITLQARHNLLCGNSVIVRNGAFPSIDFNAVGAGTAPAELNLGQTGTFNYSILSFDTEIRDLHPQGEYCFDITVPANMEYNPVNTFEWVSRNGNIIITPSSIVPAGVVMGPATIHACFDDAFGNSIGQFRNSNLNIDLTYVNCTCGTNVAAPAELYFNYGDNCADQCELRIICETGLTHLKPGGCCGPCNGVSINNYSIERTCLGEPDLDEDGCPDVLGTSHSNEMRLDRIMQGDQARFTAAGSIRLTTGTPS